jgi:hypothetical protein
VLDAVTDADGRFAARGERSDERDARGRGAFCGRVRTLRRYRSRSWLWRPTRATAPLAGLQLRWRDRLLELIVELDGVAGPRPAWVALASSHPPQVAVPAVLDVPTGASQASVTLRLPDDYRGEEVRITASLDRKRSSAVIPTARPQAPPALGQGLPTTLRPR